jgi:hypothetical protein
MNWDSVLIQTKGCLANLVVELVNPCIDLSFESFNLFTFGTLHFLDFGLHEFFHVLRVTKRHLLSSSFRDSWSLGSHRRSLPRVL